MPPPAKRSGPAARPSSANGGSSTAPSPTAWRKPVTGSSPSRVCRQVSGAACAPPMPLSDCTRSSSEGSRPRPCCHRPIPPPCCSGHCSLPDRSTCARSMGWQTKDAPPRPGTPEYDEFQRKQEAELARDKSHDPKPEHCKNEKATSVIQHPIDHACSTDDHVDPSKSD